MFDLGTIKAAESPLYTTGSPASTYIRRPPYWEGALAGERAIEGHASIWLILGDNITTDHLSPSNAILARQRSR